MCGRKPDKQCDIDGIQRFRNPATLQFLGDGKECENIETLVFGFIPQIGNALFGQRIVLVVPANVVCLEPLQTVRGDQTGSKKSIGRLDRLVPVINRLIMKKPPSMEDKAGRDAPLDVSVSIYALCSLRTTTTQNVFLCVG